MCLWLKLSDTSDSFDIIALISTDPWNVFGVCMNRAESIPENKYDRWIKDKSCVWRWNGNTEEIRTIEAG